MCQGVGEGDTRAQPASCPPELEMPNIALLCDQAHLTLGKDPQIQVEDGGHSQALPQNHNTRLSPRYLIQGARIYTASTTWSYRLGVEPRATVPVVCVTT